MPANQRVGHLSTCLPQAAHTAPDTASGADRREIRCVCTPHKCRASARIGDASRRVRRALAEPGKGPVRMSVGDEEIRPIDGFKNLTQVGRRQRHPSQRR